MVRARNKARVAVAALAALLCWTLAAPETLALARKTVVPGGGGGGVARVNRFFSGPKIPPPAELSRLLAQRQRGQALLNQLRSHRQASTTPMTSRLIDDINRHLVTGSSFLQQNRFRDAEAEFQRALEVGARLQSLLRAPSPNLPSNTVLEQQAENRLRAERIDRRRLLRAEELLNKVRIILGKTDNDRIRMLYDEAQNNLLRIRDQISKSPTARFTASPGLELPATVRPLLEVAMRNLQAALRLHEVEERVEVDALGRRDEIRELRGAVEPRGARAQRLVELADQLVERSDDALRQGQPEQARAFLGSARRYIERARLAERQSRAAGADRAASGGDGESGEVQKAAPPRETEARQALERLSPVLRRARTRLARGDDDVARQLLAQAETIYRRAEDLLEQGKHQESLALSTLAGRILRRAYER